MKINTQLNNNSLIHYKEVLNGNQTQLD